MVHELCAAPFHRPIDGPIGIHPREVMKFGTPASQPLSKNFAGLAPVEPFPGVFDHFGTRGYILRGKHSQAVNPRRQHTHVEAREFLNAPLRRLGHRALRLRGQCDGKLRSLGMRLSCFPGQESPCAKSGPRSPRYSARQILELRSTAAARPHCRPITRIC